MAVWVLFQISLELLATVAVLDRVPESEVEGVSGRIGMV